MSLLMQMPPDMLFGAMVALDHVSLCRAQATSRALFELGRDQYVWQKLYESERGRLAVLAQPTDWICAFRRLRPAWDFPVLDPESEHCWRALAHAKDVPEGLGGQDPKLFDLGGGKLLVLAGASYAERQGGIRLRQTRAMAYLLDLAAMGSSRIDTHVASDLSVQQDASREPEASHAEQGSPWLPVEVDGDAPPSLHGSYAGVLGDGVVADRLVTYGGGNHVACHGTASALDLTELPRAATWHGLDADSGLHPGPRYAGASTVWDGALVVLAGRYYGEFFDGSELWLMRQQETLAEMRETASQDRSTAHRVRWDRMLPSGEPPSERVWASALTIGNQVLVYGGALWSFDSSCWGNDGPGTVWVCSMREEVWSRIDAPAVTKAPRMRVGAQTAVCGQHLFVYGGCDLERRRYLDDAWLLDLSGIRDRDTESNVMDDTDSSHAGTWTRMQTRSATLAGARSHGVAISVPSRRAVIVFGGAQYLNGEYFRDLVQLEPIVPQVPMVRAAVAAETNTQRAGSHRTCSVA